MDGLKQHAKRTRSSGHSVWSSLILMILFLILTAVSCADKPDPGFSPLAFVSPIAMSEPQYPYIQFILSESVIGLPGTLTVESELRVVDGETITTTQTIAVMLPETGETTDGDMFHVVRWSVVDIGEEWIRATLHVIESDTIEHDFYARMYVGYGEPARSDERRFYYHRLVEPFVLRFPFIVD